MRRLPLLLLLGACSSPTNESAPPSGVTATAPAAAAPSPVEAPTAAEVPKPLLEAAESCHHWMGEEPTDEARQAEIARGMKKDCAQATDLLRQNRARLSASSEAVLSIVLESGMNPTRCAAVPTTDDPNSMLDDEARAACGK